MILSDRDIRRALEAGRIGIDPFDEIDIQPSSVDLHVDRFFRVFHNARYPFIDVKKPMQDLTEIVEVAADDPFILHPGEFVLGSTLEYVRLPRDLVARLEGKSSLGRLGLLIHSSLPGDEEVLFFDGQTLVQIPIEQIVRKRLDGCVVGFDPGTFDIQYHRVTGWHEFPPDQIYEVRLATGRRVRLTGGHDLFTIDRDGALSKVRVHELSVGTQIAVPGIIPDPPKSQRTVDIASLAPEPWHDRLMCGGPSVDSALRDRGQETHRALEELGVAPGYFDARRQLPLSIAHQLNVTLGANDWMAVRGDRHRIQALLQIDEELAWLLGLYVAEGSRRAKGLTISNTDEANLDRAQAVLGRLGLPVRRHNGGITCCSALLAEVIGWMGCGGRASSKRIPSVSLGWESPLLEAFLSGFVDGNGAREKGRTSLRSSSQLLVGDLLVLCSRLGKGARSSKRKPGDLWQVRVPHQEHDLLTSAPLPDRLLEDVRRQGEALQRLNRLVNGGLRWDRIVEVRRLAEAEPVFDLEVRPSGRPIENFVAGFGGVFVSNTAGYVDPGFEGHLTLELSNVANLPITIYPGMKIGQISFFQLTSPADNPYGSDELGSKYQGQRGPTPSQFFKNFHE